MLNSLLNARYASALINNAQSTTLQPYPVIIVLLLQTVFLSLAMAVDILLVTSTDTPLLSCLVCVGYFCLISYPKNIWRLIALPFFVFHLISNQHLLDNLFYSMLFSLFTLALIIVLAFSTQQLLRDKDSFSLPFIHVVVGFGVLLSVGYQIVYIALYFNSLAFDVISAQWSLFSMGQIVGFIISFSILLMYHMLIHQHFYGMRLLTFESYVFLTVMTIMTGITLIFGGKLVHYLSIYLVIPVVWFCYRYRWWGMTSFTFVINFFSIAFVITNAHLFKISTGFTYQELVWFLLAVNLFSLYLNAMVFELDEIQRVNQKNQVLMKARNKELTQVNEQIEELNRHLLSAQERQRQKLSRQLEKLMGKNISVLQQTITLLEMQASLSKKDNNPFSAIKKFTNIIYLSVHELINWLRPEMLERLGLINTLESKLFKDALALNNIHYNFELRGELVEIPNDIALPLFRVVQEAVSNAIKHSNADTFTITCELDEARLQLWITDNGDGFDYKKVKRGFGLNSMKNRIDAINGTFNMSSDDGVLIHINTPV